MKWSENLDEMGTVLQVCDDRYVQALVARGEGEWAAGYAVPHTGVLSQGLAQVAPGLWVLDWPGSSAQSRSALHDQRTLHDTKAKT